MAEHSDSGTLWWALGGVAALFALSRRSQIVDAVEAQIYEPRLEAYLPIFRDTSVVSGVPVSWLAAVGHAESSFRADAVNTGAGDANRGGAWGLMQMTWDTAVPLMQRLGYTFEYPDLDFLNDNLDRYTGPLVGIMDPHVNVALAALSLSDARRTCGADPREAGCYYNGGGCCVRVRSADAVAYGDRLAQLAAHYLYLDLDIGIV